MRDSISNKFHIITIDGESACGKSSIGESLSIKLRYSHIDSGMLFRTLAFAIEIQKLNISQTDKQTFERVFKNDCTFEGTKVSYQGKNISEDIHSEEVGLLASELGKFERVQNWFINYQKDLGTKIEKQGFSGMFVSGRIGGSITFPNADRKFYLKASLQAKAIRRYEQLMQVNSGIIDFEKVKNSILQRDNIKDIISYRKIDIPIDTITIDTTNLSLENLFQLIHSTCLDINQDTLCCQSSSVPGGRNTNSRTSASLVR